jgi:hypothetical protein
VYVAVGDAGGVVSVTDGKPVGQPARLTEPEADVPADGTVSVHVELKLTLVPFNRLAAGTATEVVVVTPLNENDDVTAELLPTTTLWLTLAVPEGGKSWYLSDTDEQSVAWVMLTPAACAAPADMASAATATPVARLSRLATPAPLGMYSPFPAHPRAPPESASLDTDGRSFKAP